MRTVLCSALFIRPCLQSSSQVRWRVALFAVAAMVTAFGAAAGQAVSPAPAAKASIGVSPLADFLQREIIGTNTVLEEVQAFVENRIPRLAAVRSADDWQKQADAMRQAVLERVVFRGEAAAWRDAQGKVDWLETMAGGPGYRIKKLRYEALPGLWIPALLYEPESLSGRVPAMLNVNGHDANGKAAPYKQIRSINLAKRGMLVLNVEWLGMGQLREPGLQHYRMNQLDLCGTSGLAPFYLAMKRALDLLLALEHADPKRVAVSGLSGGGWQTIFISALDPRVTLCNPVAGYSGFFTRARHASDLGDSEQTPSDLATVADYTHLTAMLAPRPALLTYNFKDDCCFASGHALPPLLEAAQPIYRLFGKESHLRSHINYEPGTHNYEKDNREQFYRFVGDHFFAGVSDFRAEEIPCAEEVKTKEQLEVALPAGNADFHTLAMSLTKALPRQTPWPSDLTAAKRWQQTRRQTLQELIRSKNYQATGEKGGVVEQAGLKATFWQLKMSGLWTVPMVELTRGEATSTAILVADTGRASVADEAARLLARGSRVLAVDPFYFGESKIRSRDYLYALLVAAVGERPLGIQANQLLGLARWAQNQFPSAPVRIVAVGPRTGLSALIAAALEENAIAGAELHGALGSLKEVIEQNWAVNERPELFCFGLLQDFDIKQIAALVAPRPVEMPDAGDRVKRELAGLDDWYRLWGTEFRPW